MDPRLKAEITARDKWFRLLYIIGYALMFQIAEIVLALTVAIQFVWTLFTGQANASLRDFGARIGTWLRQIVAYVTWASDERPWPFGLAWPTSDANDSRH